MNLFVTILLFPFLFANEATRNDRAIFDDKGNVLDESEVGTDAVNWELLNNSNGQNNQWKSVGQISGFRGVCTTTLFFPPQCGNSETDIANQKAQVITNGHCTLGEPADPQVNFNFFKDVDQSQKIKASISEVKYSTMKRYDVAIAQLDMTYGELARLGVHPKKISTKPASGELTNIAIPVNGIEKDDRFIRKNTCPTGQSSSLIEGAYVWPDAFSMNCSVSGGSSGSALFNDQGEIAGLANTGRHNQPQNPEPCGDNDPCDISSGELRSPLTNYGFNANMLHKCYKNCQLDTKQKDCLLPNDPKMINSSHAQHINSFDKRIDLRLGFTSGYEAYKVKICRTSDTSCNCYDSSGYKEIRGESFRMGDFLKPPPQNEHFSICAIGKENGQWQDTKDVTVLPTFYDNEAPQFEASIVKVNDQPMVKVREQDRWNFYNLAFSATSDCIDVSYRPARVVSNLILNAGPMRPRAGDKYACVKSFDRAGNQTFKTLPL